MLKRAETEENLPVAKGKFFRQVSSRMASFYKTLSLDEHFEKTKHERVRAGVFDYLAVHSLCLEQEVSIAFLFSCHG